MSSKQPADGKPGEKKNAPARLANENEAQYQERLQLLDRIRGIRHKILVLSGKGGVGKSTVAVNLARSLFEAGKRVGILDIDIHGPSIPKLLGLEGHSITGAEDYLLPVELSDGFKVMSIGFLLPSRDDAVIWRGPRKYGVIKQFLKDVQWGNLDYLIVDSPPGTGDEPLTIAQLIDRVDGAIVVTTPQQVAITDVRKCITFCRQVNVPVLGVLENMSGFTCPHCNKRVDIFKTGGGEVMANEMNVPFLGRVPIDPEIVNCGDAGTFLAGRVQAQTYDAFADAVRPILEIDRQEDIADKADKADHPITENHRMKIAVPLVGGKLSMHFGHCEEFAFFEVDKQAKTITDKALLAPPGHEPGMLPRWLKDNGADLIIAGGMGSRAQDLFAQSGIDTLTGALADVPEAIIDAYLAGTLEAGDNICDH